MCVRRCTPGRAMLAMILQAWKSLHPSKTLRLYLLCSQELDLSPRAAALIKAAIGGSSATLVDPGTPSLTRPSSACFLLFLRVITRSSFLLILSCLFARIHFSWRARYLMIVPCSGKWEAMADRAPVDEYKKFKQATPWYVGFP